MGKADVATMPINNHHQSIYPIYSASNGKNDEKEQPSMPIGMQFLDNQVAGHMLKGKSYGLIKYKNSVLKPIISKDCYDREVYFYTELENTVDQSLTALRDLVPKYQGEQLVPIDGKPLPCIKLEDLTRDMKEPCIMDIKIGRRTWDPNASYAKIRTEESKYVQCRQQLSFCIPGFQVYRVYSGELCKFGKDYGKGLDKDGAVDAIKEFLNADQGFNRSLIVQMLANLWRIQHWIRNQRRLRLYSSSLLLVYDARRLRECQHRDLKSELKLQRKNSLYRPMSMAVLNRNDPERVPTGFSGQLTKDGPILLHPCKKLLDVPQTLVHMTTVNNNVWQKSIRTLKRTHSFQNNYDKDVQTRKQNYTYMLDELCTDSMQSECWASVKMIDFSHVYPADNCDIDRNYLEGVENLVKIFEEFLIESE